MSAGLRWFVVLAEEGQVTAAADILHIAQPTLSRRLATLEKQMGVDLFDRHGRRLGLNDHGRILYEHARRALEELDAAESRIAELTSPTEGTVRLDFLHSLGSWLVPSLIRSFHRTSPRVQFALHQGASGHLAQRILAGHSDLAAVSPRPRAEGLGWLLLDHQRLALAVPSGHHLADRTDIGLRDAAGEPFVAMHPNYGMRRLLDEAAERAGFEPRIVLESSELATALGLVSAGLGVALVPVREAEPDTAGVAVVPIRGDDAVREVGMVWALGRTLTAPARRFLDHVTAETVEH